VALGGEPVTDFATDKARALLAYLVVEADYPHRRDALAGLLWPDEPESRARQNLRQALSYLRQAIGDQDEAVPFLLINRRTIQFNRDSNHWLDVAEFATCVEASRRHRHRGLESCLPCVHRLEEMTDLYRGDFLQQFFLSDSGVFEEWASLKREWFHREVVGALRHLGRYHERRGNYRQAQAFAWRQISLEPWREEAHRRLMRLLALDGQRSAALAQYEACRQALDEELGVEPTGETKALYEQLRDSASQPISGLESHDLSLLPSAPTPFVGRETELAELAELLANPDCRLVTLVGPGGIGKSRLALRAATDQMGCFSHGVTFVSLAAVSSSDLLISAIVDSLDFSFREQEDPEHQLLDYLREKELLLVLDSIEHILEGANLVSRIIRHASGVIVVATSRERLNLQEESVYVLDGLGYPRGEANRGTESRQSTNSTDALETYSAIELFQQQARRVYDDFSLSDGTASQVVRICQLVEGLPLGVELAASWTRVRSCRDIAREIAHNLDVLSTDLRNVPERQRSIRATFEYSWQLLSSKEKDLLARLSVFSGGIRREVALQVTETSLSILLALTDKSLLSRVGADRYDMHALLRQYAHHKLSASPQKRAETEMEHASYFAAFLERQREQLRTARGKNDFAPLASESENIRKAWQLAVAHDSSPLIEQSLESLYLFYDFQCRFQEGIDLLSIAIERWADDPERRCLLGKLLSHQGALYLQVGQYRRARAALERSLTLLKSPDMTAERVFSLVSLARLAHRQGDYEETVHLSKRSLALSQQIGDRWGITHSLVHLGVVRYRMGDVNKARVLLEESLEAAQASDNPRLIIAPLNWLGDVACHQGDYVTGQTLFERCLALTRETGDNYRVAVALNNLGTVFHVLGKVEKAQSAYQESLDVCREIGNRRRQAIALSNLGELAYETGAYADAERLYREGLAIGREMHDQWILMACLNNLGEIAHTVRRDDEAWHCFAEVLAIAQATQTLPLIFKILVNLSTLFVREGERDFAVELLTLTQHHPASEQVVQDKAGRLLDEMELVPPETTDRSLDEVVAEALTRIEQNQR
jgi:predicted ATPase/Tfp pilus assembly protein PilF